jgi:hypothetical protein
LQRRRISSIFSKSASSKAAIMPSVVICSGGRSRIFAMETRLDEFGPAVLHQVFVDGLARLVGGEVLEPALLPARRRDLAGTIPHRWGRLLRTSTDDGVRWHT